MTSCCIAFKLQNSVRRTIPSCC